MAETQEQTFTSPINGRDILFRPPTDAQILLVGRLLRKAEELGQDMGLDDLDTEEGRQKAQGAMGRISKMLDIIDSMVVHPADRDWLEQQIIDRKLDLTQLMMALKPQAEKAAPNRATKRAAVKKSTRARTT